jgi:hypothetical protein
VAGGQLVDEPDGHGHDDVHVTGEIHLTGYAFAA